LEFNSSCSEPGGLSTTSEDRLRDPGYPSGDCWDETFCLISIDPADLYLYSGADLRDDVD
jgi:hypothetical protein